MSIEARAVALHHQTRTPQTLAGGLRIVWIAVTDADHASCCIRLVDVRTVDGVNTEQHHIAPLGGHGDGIVETVFFRRQVWGTGPIFGLVI